jgi:hypothetical protein
MIINCEKHGHIELVPNIFHIMSCLQCHRDIVQQTVSSFQSATMFIQKVTEDFSFIYVCKLCSFEFPEEHKHTNEECFYLTS